MRNLRIEIVFSKFRGFSEFSGLVSLVGFQFIILE